VILCEEAVEILEASAGSLRGISNFTFGMHEISTYFWVQEVYNGHERSVQDGPDDVEAPVKRVDANGRDFHNCSVIRLVPKIEQGNRTHP
jgi:hypothetical protein